jgi:hypothetical protein
MKHKRRQRAEQRAKMFRRGTKPELIAGRQKGSKVPLLKNSRRREICVWATLRTAGFERDKAAILAAVFDSRSIWYSHQDQKRNLEGLQAVYQGGLRPADHPDSFALQDRVKYILDHADEAIANADEAGFAWLQQSAGYLAALFKFARDNNGVGIEVTADKLKGLGWSRGVLRRILERTPPKLLK